MDPYGIAAIISSLALLVLATATLVFACRVPTAQIVKLVDALAKLWETLRPQWRI